MSRREHPKSRHGCAQCKAGHVKCDLSRPACGRCTKTKRSCEFGMLLESRSLRTPTRISNQQAPGSAPLCLAIPSQHGTARLPPFSCLSDTVSWGDLELLHHYLTATYTTLASRDDLLQMWKVEVPKLALKQRFLMHSLFSVTALHMASAQLENQTSYVDTAIQHHGIAIREYSSNLNGINQENSAALFICATLIVVSALNLAVARPHKELKGPVDNILSIFILLRGVKVVLAEMWPWVEDSEIAPMFKGRDIDNTTVLSDDIDNALRQLEDRSQSMADADGNSATYSLTIRGLKECFRRVPSKMSDNGMALSWPINVGPAYIALLASRQSMALLILAHYAVILDEIKDVWWAGGWGKQLVEDINQMVDDDWKTLIAWPMEKVGATNST